MLYLLKIVKKLKKKKFCPIMFSEIESLETITAKIAKGEQAVF